MKADDLRDVAVHAITPPGPVTDMQVAQAFEVAEAIRRSTRLSMIDLADLIAGVNEVNAYQLEVRSQDTLREAARIIHRLYGAHRVPDGMGRVIVLAP